MRFMTTAMITISDIKQTVHARYGPGIRGFAGFLHTTFLRRNTFFIFSRQPVEESSVSADSENLEFVRNDHERLNNFREIRLLPKEFHCDKTHGARDFVLGLWRGEPAYIHWIFHEGTRTRFLNLGMDCAEIGYIVTLPEYRGNGICSKALVHTLGALSNEGIQRVFCVIHEDNIASIKSAERAGFRESGRARTIGPFNKRRDASV